MKNIIVISIFILFCCFAIIFLYTSKKSALSSEKIEPAIFFIPHQDDETLSMGVAITQHLDAGRDVIIVLYTNGEGSVAQKILNGQRKSNWWGSIHDPNKEGYGYVNDQTFTQARTKEFMTALLQLGVKRENIHIRPLLPIPNLKTVKQLILEYAYKYPNASYKAMSQHDSSLSHALSGQALVDLYHQHIISDIRLFVSRNDFTKLKNLGFTIKPNFFQAYRIKKAALVYQTWNPKGGFFAIGYHSVASQFESMLSNIENRQHNPSE
ncbi:PIG-L family deacetylase [Shimazuella kribbensis]|uniref:PIG-L family deacetylase n=1 Tax=Shimazuella kribbensis TaxID=139808 RepID=UPI00048F2AA3|nr:PIG-L family deacetylase [Shimazuella kribbensis]